ncbi:hypothetical protein IGI04_035879 [Brassica rapa subsp. trilocularis]|uniref:Uncharacterized protein n=1 Tax=Brassica rapa subsp. trilocularis TaxID=1813537 RepID=A0ABQ7LCT4_BRACM|nr:hypothetical protein IGI04_035879 [Brassica rapa subsp. trilocularis]
MVISKFLHSFVFFGCRWPNAGQRDAMTMQEHPAHSQKLSPLAILSQKGSRIALRPSRTMLFLAPLLEAKNAPIARTREPLEGDDHRVGSRPHGHEHIRPLSRLGEVVHGDIAVDGDRLRRRRHQASEDPILRRNPANRPRIRTVPRVVGAAAAQPQSEVPDIQHIPNIPMCDHGDFQHVVLDALHAIWARVSHCRCVI